MDRGRNDLDGGEFSGVTHGTLVNRLTGEFFITRPPVQGWSEMSGRRGMRLKNLTTSCQFKRAMFIGLESIMADAYKSFGEHMQEKATHKLMRGQGHDLLLVGVTVIAPEEVDLPLL